MEECHQSKPRPLDADAEGIDEFACMPSTCPEIDIELRNFATEELAKQVGKAIHTCLHAYGKYLNLKRLLRVIVSYDYDQALAGIDRGVPVSQTLAATNDGIAVGIAMTPTVFHEGELRSVMVLNAAYMAVLIQDDTVELARLPLKRIYRERSHTAGFRGHLL